MPTHKPVSPREVRDWRQSHQFTMRAAGSAFGVTERTWARYEHGDSPIPAWLTRAIRHGIQKATSL